MRVPSPRRDGIFQKNKILKIQSGCTLRPFVRIGLASIEKSSGTSGRYGRSSPPQRRRCRPSRHASHPRPWDIPSPTSYTHLCEKGGRSFRRVHTTATARDRQSTAAKSIDTRRRRSRRGNREQQPSCTRPLVCNLVQLVAGFFNSPHTHQRPSSSAGTSSPLLSAQPQ
jgi:hypothetical protein